MRTRGVFRALSRRRGRSVGSALVVLAIASAFAIGLQIGEQRLGSPDHESPRAGAPSVRRGDARLPIVQPSPARLERIEGSVDPHDLELAELVPRGGKIDHIWFVPAGQAAPQLVLAWHRGLLRGTPATGYEDSRRWNLTLWNPEPAHGPWKQWIPHPLVVSSPFPIGGSAIELADVTRDGHADLLVSIRVGNHDAQAVSVFATSGRTVRRIYGSGYERDKLGGGVHGRLIIETHWGSRNGHLWFDEPRGGQSVCCPDFRLRYQLRWTGRRWQRVSQHRVRMRYE